MKARLKGRLLATLSATLWATLLAAAGQSVAAQPAAADDEEMAVYTPVRNEELYRAALLAVAEGRREDAVDLLVRFIASEPRHAGAVLELALAQCELGNAVEAERLFADLLQRFAPPPAIQEVIAAQRAGGCQRAVLRPASWQLSTGRGHDNNVNQGASNPTFSIGSGANQGEYALDPEFLPRADNYTLLTGSYVRPLNAGGTLGIVQAYARRHDHLREQDNTSLLAGLEHNWTLGRWRARATGTYGAATLNGKMYQRQQQVQLRAAPPVALPPNLDLMLASTLSHVSYPTRAAYDANTLELGLLLTYRNKQHQVQATASVLGDRADASRPGGDRNGWLGSVQWYTALDAGLYAEAGLTHQHWHSARWYAPGLIDVARRQNTSQLRAAVQWYLVPRLSVQLEARLARNRENISLFQYNSRALQLSMRWDNF